MVNKEYFDKSMIRGGGKIKKNVKRSRNEIREHLWKR